MKIEYQKIKINTLTKEDIGRTVRYGKLTDKHYAIVFNVSERGVELLFGNNTLPLLIGNKDSNINILETILIDRN